MRALCTLCKSLLICFTSSTVKINALFADFRPVENGGREISPPPQLIIKILIHLGLPSRAPPRSPARRVDLFQTIRGAENHLPTQADGAARSEFDRARDLQSRARTYDLRAAPRPCRKLLLNSAVLDRLGALAIYLRSEK